MNADMNDDIAKISVKVDGVSREICEKLHTKPLWWIEITDDKGRFTLYFRNHDHLLAFASSLSEAVNKAVY